MLLTKSLVGLQAPTADADSDDEKKYTLGELVKRDEIKVVEPVYVTPEASLDSILAIFRKGSVHCAIVTNQPKDIAQEAKASAHYLKKGDDKADANSVASGLGQTRYTYHGIVTMENVLEGMLNMSIKDEKDLSRDVEQSFVTAGDESGEFKPPIYSSIGPNNSLLMDENRQVFRPTFFGSIVDAVKTRLTGASGASTKLRTASGAGNINAIDEDDEEIMEEGATVRKVDGIDKEGGSSINQ